MRNSVPMIKSCSFRNINGKTKRDSRSWEISTWSIGAIKENIRGTFELLAKRRNCKTWGRISEISETIWSSRCWPYPFSEAKFQKYYSNNHCSLFLSFSCLESWGLSCILRCVRKVSRCASEQAWTWVRSSRILRTFKLWKALSMNGVQL